MVLSISLNLSLLSPFSIKTYCFSIELGKTDFYDKRRIPKGRTEETIHRAFYLNHIQRCHQKPLE